MDDLAPATAAIGNRRDRLRATTSPNQVLAIVCVGIILANLDLFIVNVGIPNIAHDLHNSNLEDLSWILNGYAIAYAALLIFFGRLAERYPRNLSFLLGVGTFTVASGACAVVDSVEWLVVFRVVQAAGAALMTPTSLGLLLASFPPDKRAGAVRTWTAIGGFAAALGPLVGGVLVTASWRWIFLVNVPIGLIALWIGWRRLPYIAGHDAPAPNVWAAALVTGGIASLTFAIVKVNDWGWASLRIGVTVAVAVVCIALFVRHCLRSANPFVDPSLFGARQFTGATLAMTAFSAAFGAMLLSIVLWQQSVWGWSAIQIGAAIAPGPLLVPIVSLTFSKRLIARFGAAQVIAAGVASFAVGLLIWATMLTPESGHVAAVGGMAFIGIGVGLALPTLMGVGMATLPPSSFATGSGVLNMIRQSAMAIGVAVLVAIVGAAGTASVRTEAFHHAWWLMIVAMLLTILPTLILIKVSAGHKRL
ncbi:MAG: transporter [Rhizobacter sp.]|nr:transporter [Rhizobacter sp.]